MSEMQYPAPSQTSVGVSGSGFYQEAPESQSSLNTMPSPINGSLVLNTTPSPINSSLVPMDYLLLVFPKWVFSLLLLKLLVVFRHGGLFFENVRFLYLYYIAGIRRGSSCSPRNVYHPGPSSLLPGQPVSSRTKTLPAPGR